ncbi:hypothetical protein CRG98_018426, partial [Punica granatum]
MASELCRNTGRAQVRSLHIGWALCLVVVLLIFLVKLYRIAFLVGRNGRVQSCNYSSSSRCGHKEPITNRITAVKDESSPSWHNYVIPTLFVGGLAGFAMLLHYNDEKRAVLK